MTIESTFVATFGGGDSEGFRVAELDDVLNISASGEVISSFAPTDEVWFWVQHDSSLQIARVAATRSDVMIVDCGVVERQRTQDLLFVGDSVELSYIPTSMPELSWSGTVGSGVIWDGRKLSISGDGPCDCVASYSIRVRLFRLIPPAGLQGEASKKFRPKVAVYLQEVAA